MMRKFAAEAQPASLHSESLWTAVNLFDRFISKQKLSGAQNDLNVVADACLFIAAKLDDEQITRITSNTQVLDMESTILKSIDWNVPLVSPYVFYHEIQENFKSEQVTGFKAKSMKVFSMYMSEILEDLRFQSFPPSTIAMSAFLSIHHYDAALSANGGRVMWGKVARFLEIESDQKQIKRLKDCFKLLSDLVK